MFLIPGSGRYPLQPVFVEDVAELAVEAGHQKADQIIDAAGPETYTDEGLVRLIAHTIGSRPRIVRVPPWVGLGCAKRLASWWETSSSPARNSTGSWRACSSLRALRQAEPH